MNSVSASGGILRILKQDGIVRSHGNTRCTKINDKRQASNVREKLKRKIGIVFLSLN